MLNWTTVTEQLAKSTSIEELKKEAGKDASADFSSGWASPPIVGDQKFSSVKGQWRIFAPNKPVQYHIDPE